MSRWRLQEFPVFICVFYIPSNQFVTHYEIFLYVILKPFSRQLTQDSTGSFLNLLLPQTGRVKTCTWALEFHIIFIYLFVTPNLIRSFLPLSLFTSPFLRLKVVPLIQLIFSKESLLLPFTILITPLYPRYPLVVISYFLLSSFTFLPTGFKIWN